MYHVHHWEDTVYIGMLKDTLKVSDDFKNKQKSVSSDVF